MRAKLTLQEIEMLFKQLEKTKFVSVKESPNLIVVSITEFGKKKETEYREHCAAKRKLPPENTKFSA